MATPPHGARPYGLRGASLDQGEALAGALGAVQGAVRDDVAFDVHEEHRQASGGFLRFRSSGVDKSRAHDQRRRALALPNQRFIDLVANQAPMWPCDKKLRRNIL